MSCLGEEQPGSLCLVARTEPVETVGESGERSVVGQCTGAKHEESQGLAARAGTGRLVDQGGGVLRRAEHCGFGPLDGLPRYRTATQ